MADQGIAKWAEIIVKSDGISDWDRKFCASIISQGRKGRHLSLKQVEIMDRMIAGFKDRTMRDDQGSAI